MSFRLPAIRPPNLHLLLRLPRLGLRAKLLISFGLVLLPILGLLIYSYRFEVAHRRQDIMDDQVRTAQAVAAMVDTAFSEAIAVGIAMASDPRMLATDPTQLDPILRELLSYYPQFENLTVFDAAGNNLGAARLPPDGVRPNIADRTYFQRTIRTGQPTVSEVIIGRFVLRPIVVVSVPLRGPGARIVGAVLISLDLDFLVRRVENVQLLPEQAILVIDRTGRLAIHSLMPELSWEERDLSGEPAIQEVLTSRVVRLDEFRSPILRDVRMAAFVSTPQYGWVVGVTVPVELVMVAAREVLRTGLLALGATAILIGIIALALANWFLGPVRRLTEHAVALGQGLYGRRVHIVTGDELEELGRTFNEMADRIERAMGELRAVLDSVESAVIVIDTWGTVRFVSRRSGEIFGVDLSGMIGLREEELLRRIQPRLRNPRGFQERNAWLRQHPVEQIADEWELVDGKVLERYAAPVRTDDTLLGRIEVYHDVTEERRSIRLQQEFLFLVSHEFRTPLTVVLGNLGLVEHRLVELHDGAAVREVAKRLERARVAAWRLTAMVDELLDATAIQAGRLELFREPVFLPGLIREVLTKLHDRTAAHRLVLRLPEQFPQVMADRRRIAQVVTNLVINATKYTPPGTEIEIGLVQQGSEAVVYVRDSGPGIAPEEIPKLFDPFYRVRAPEVGLKEGLGLGLYINRAIVEIHGGRMWVESQVGRGTTFYFTLPLVHPSP